MPDPAVARAGYAAGGAAMMTMTSHGRFGERHVAGRHPSDAGNLLSRALGAVRGA